VVLTYILSVIEVVLVVVLLLWLLMSGHQYLSSSSLECARAKTRTRTLSWMRTRFRTRGFRDPLQPPKTPIPSHTISSRLVSWLDADCVWQTSCLATQSISFFAFLAALRSTDWAQGLARLIKRPEIHTFAHLANLPICAPAQ